jgi:hypothetical protein
MRKPRFIANWQLNYYANRFELDSKHAEAGGVRPVCQFFFDPSFFIPCSISIDKVKFGGAFTFKARLRVVNETELEKSDIEFSIFKSPKYILHSETSEFDEEELISFQKDQEKRIPPELTFEKYNIHSLDGTSILGNWFNSRGVPLFLESNSPHRYSPYPEIKDSWDKLWNNDRMLQTAHSLFIEPILELGRKLMKCTLSLDCLEHLESDIGIPFPEPVRFLSGPPACTRVFGHLQAQEEVIFLNRLNEIAANEPLVIDLCNYDCCYLASGIETFLKTAERTAPIAWVLPYYFRHCLGVNKDLRKLGVDPKWIFRDREEAIQALPPL